MQPKIAQEIAFLKNFRSRFQHVVDYKAALGDMLKEGLITEKAYKEVIASIKSSKVPQTKTSKPRSVNIAPTDPEPDPCHMSHYRRNPC